MKPVLVAYCTNAGSTEAVVFDEIKEAAKTCARPVDFEERATALYLTLMRKKVETLIPDHMQALIRGARKFGCLRQLLPSSCGQFAVADRTRIKFCVDLARETGGRGCNTLR